MDGYELKTDIQFVASYLNEKRSIGYIRQQRVNSGYSRLITKEWHLAWPSGGVRQMIAHRDVAGSMHTDPSCDNLESMFEKFIWWRQYVGKQLVRLTKRH